MRKNAPKCTFLTILDLLTSAQLCGIYIMHILFATNRKVAKKPTLCSTLHLLLHITPTYTMTSPLPACITLPCTLNVHFIWLWGETQLCNLSMIYESIFFIFLQTFSYFFQLDNIFQTLLLHILCISMVSA